MATGAGLGWKCLAIRAVLLFLVMAAFDKLHCHSIVLSLYGASGSSSTLISEQKKVSLLFFKCLLDSSSISCGSFLVFSCLSGKIHLEIHLARLLLRRCIVQLA